MATLFLIRHGENDYVKEGRLAGRLPGVHLNERGRLQADGLAAALQNAPLDAIYSSPLERALETAEPLARAKRLEVNVREGLMETNAGEWTGRELKDLRELPEWKLVQEQPSRFRFPGGETFAEQQVRLVAEVERICAAHEPTVRVALVFHADPIKVVIAHYLGMPLDNFQRIGCDTGSLSILVLKDTTAILLKQNLRPPFELEFPPEVK